MYLEYICVERERGWKERLSYRRPLSSFLFALREREREQGKAKQSNIGKHTAAVLLFVVVASCVWKQQYAGERGNAMIATMSGWEIPSYHACLSILQTCTPLVLKINACMSTF